VCFFDALEALGHGLHTWLALRVGMRVRVVGAEGGGRT